MRQSLVVFDVAFFIDESGENGNRANVLEATENGTRSALPSLESGIVLR
jgi:hypothetical protein